MTFILGLASILQAVFLPGYLISGLFAPVKGFSRLLISFGLSLLINYQFVLLMIALGAYDRLSVLVFFAIECIALVWMLSRKRVSRDPQVLAIGDRTWSGVVVKEPWKPVFRTCFYLLSLLIALGFAAKTLWQNPGIFNSWDDVVSWNRWATEWYEGNYPAQTYHYPQLVSANWSMMYHFIGNTGIQFFAKSIMVLFAWGILFMLFDLYRKLRSDFFLAGVAWAGLVIIQLAGNYIGTGYMDIPLAFFCISIFYLLLLSAGGHLPVKTGLFLASAFLAAAILVKQGGIFMVLPFIIGCVSILKNANTGFLKRSSLVFGYIFVLLVLAGPWYAYKEIRIRSGIESSEITYVTKDIYGGKTKVERLQDGTARFFQAAADVPGKAGKVLQPVLVVMLTVLSLLSLFAFTGRFIMLVLVLPYYFIWGCFFSYDLRNITMILPFWGGALGIGSLVFVNFLPAPKGKLWNFIAAAATKLQLYLVTTGNALAGRTSRYWKPGIFLALAIVTITCSFRYSEKKLLAIEKRMAMEQLMDAELNALLYEKYDAGLLKGKILSGNEMITFLPGLKPYIERFSFDENKLEELKQLLQNGETYQFCVVHDNVPGTIWDYFKTMEAEGLILSIKKTGSRWNLVELIHKKK